MLCALIDETGRIADSVMGGAKPDGWVEFTWDSEPDGFVSAEDYVIRDGVAYYEPTLEALEDSNRRRGMDDMAKAIGGLSGPLSGSEVLSLMLESVTVSDKPASKLGFITTPHYESEGHSIVWTFEPDPNYTPTEDGTYLHPFTYTAGMAVTEGLWYTDGEDVWEAIKDGVPSSFADTEYFDIIA